MLCTFICFTPGAISSAPNIILGKEKGEHDSDAPALSPAPNNIVEKEESKEYGLFPLNMVLKQQRARAPNIAILIMILILKEENIESNMVLVHQ